MYLIDNLIYFIKEENTGSSLFNWKIDQKIVQGNFINCLTFYLEGPFEIRVNLQQHSKVIMDAQVSSWNLVLKQAMLKPEKYKNCSIS